MMLEWRHVSRRAAALQLRGGMGSASGLKRLRVCRVRASQLRVFHM